MRSRQSSPSAARSGRWADVAAVLVTVVLSVPALVWFGKSWALVFDATEYLLSGWHLLTGQGYTLTDGVPFTKRGPVLPALIGLLTFPLGRDTEALAWGMRLLVTVNPLLAYFLVKRVSGPAAGLLAAALLALFSYVATNPDAFNVDALLVAVYLPTLLALLVAVQRDNPRLALLSGLLLGLSIITKETAIASLPLAALAAMFTGLRLRGVALHYAGVAALCVPWWAWVFAASGEVYLIGRFPPGLRLPLVIGALVAAVTCAALYYSGIPRRLLSGERRRVRVGWALSLVWAAALSAMLLTTSAELAGVSAGTVALYIAGPLAQDIAIWPLLLVAAAYLAYKAARRYPYWQLLAAAVLFQVPACLLATLDGWDRRQFILMQALLLCALAALVVEAAGAAARDRGRTRWLGAVAAASIGVFLLVSSVTESRAMLAGESVSPVAGAKDFGTSGMVERADAEILEGETVLAPPGQHYYLSFVDGDRREWRSYGYDRAACAASPTDSADACGDRDTSGSLPESTIWLSTQSNCQTTALSSTGLLERMDGAGSEYLMMTTYGSSSELLTLADRLGEGPAFEVAHRGQSPSGAAGTSQEPLLLERTGQSAGEMPTQMSADNVPRLFRCEQAEGRAGVNERISSELPNGIVTTPAGAAGGPSRDRVEQRADQLVDSIYGEEERAAADASR